MQLFFLNSFFPTVQRTNYSFLNEEKLNSCPTFTPKPTSINFFTNLLHNELLNLLQNFFACHSHSIKIKANTSPFSFQMKNCSFMEYNIFSLNYSFKSLFMDGNCIFLNEMGNRK